MDRRENSVVVSHRRSSDLLQNLRLRNLTPLGLEQMSAGARTGLGQAHRIVGARGGSEE